MKLRSYLVLLVLGAVVPLLVFATILIVSFSRHERRATEEGLRNTARALSAAVDHELLGAMTTLEAMATSEALDTGDLLAFHRQATRILHSQRRWYTMVLLDPAGRQLLNLREPIGTALPSGDQDEQVREVLRTGSRAVSNLFAGHVSNRLLVAATVPVWRDGGIRYLLSVSIEASALTTLLTAQQLPADAVGTIIDREGRIIARSRTSEQFVGQPVGAHLWAQIREAPEGSGRGRNLDGVDIYGAHSRSALSGWTVRLAIPISGVEASLRHELVAVVGGGVLLLALGLGLAAFIARRIAGPVASLSRAAAVLGRDEALPPLARSAVSEVAELRAALAGAAGLLRDRAVERQAAEEARDRIEADLRRASEAKDEFLAMLGHELRTPIGAIRNAIQALCREPGNAEAAAELSAIINRQATHLGRLVDDLLDVSRVSSGKITLRRRPVDLTEAVGRVLEVLREAGRLTRHRIERRLEPAVVDADPTRLEQIASNLLENALKYTPDGGSIRVRVGLEDGDAVLRVGDTGIGIAPEMLTRVFEPFVQETRSLDRPAGGLGLGLTLVRRLAELHDGTVSAASQGRGHGCEFVVRLPCSTVKEAATEPAAPAAAHPLDVLVVEDHDDAREALRLLLETWGCRVVEAVDGLAGVRLALESPPDIAFVDIGLPRLDGYAVARELRQTATGRAIFLVALTGYGQPDDRRRALDAGFDSHLIKPVDADELAAVLTETEVAARTRRGASALPAGTGPPKSASE